MQTRTLENHLELHLFKPLSKKKGQEMFTISLNNLNMTPSHLEQIHFQSNAWFSLILFILN